MAKNEKEVAPKKITRGATKASVKASEVVETPAKIVSNTGDGSEEKLEVDYIRQFQYKKVNNIPTIGGKETDPDAGSKAEHMKANLLSQKRISILIPLDPGSDPKVPASVTLNGYRLDLPTNTYIEVPEQVAEIIRNSNNQTVAALNQFKIDGDRRKENSL